MSFFKFHGLKLLFCLLDIVSNKIFREFRQMTNKIPTKIFKEWFIKKKKLKNMSKKLVVEEYNTKTTAKI